MLVLLYPIQSCSNYSRVGNKLIKVLDKVWQKKLQDHKLQNHKMQKTAKSQTS